MAKDLPRLRRDGRLPPVKKYNIYMTKSDNQYQIAYVEKE